MTRRSSADLSAATEPDRIETVVTYLEMTRPPGHAPAPPPWPGLEIRHARRCTLSFYRYLYDAVGAPWTWTARKLLSDGELGAILGDPRVEVHVLWADGVPAGYVELDRRGPPDIEIAYFGLLPEFVGQGLGGFLLDWAIARAWQERPRRLRVHTCDLDHPRALGVYRKAGLEVYRQRRERVVMVPRPQPASGPEARWSISSTMPS